MSLVAYGSSDESSDEEGNNFDTFEIVNDTPEEPLIKQTNEKLCLPAPKHDKIIEEVIENDDKIHFDKLPKPISLLAESEDIVEDDDIPPKKEDEFKPEKPIKKNRAPVKITVPSLSDFKDVDEENETRSNRIKPSTKGTMLFALLPKPKGAEVKATNSLIPSIVNKAKTNQTKTLVNKDKDTKSSIADKAATMKSSIGIDYDSNSEDEDGTTISGTDSGTDFFALSVTDTPVLSDALMDELSLKEESNKFEPSTKHNSGSSYIPTSSTKSTEAGTVSQKTLVSNIMNLPKEEILLKNKAEVGPKLPVPEQEYNVDVEGNVAFDEKAIEYLCGRRSIKRKAKEIDEASVIEINGEDIKPDEREWLVKALTEEPVQRPVSMMGGVNSQSKKKHQITYLAHQAKAMEMELKNQWAQNRMTRKQTQSKYGF
ncbi:proline-rich protein PRCC [Halictus rubicundus]|uniref:proline-rich protein PRCC n=1 Tax=Halictus rubicundus TaxID=77578 RepID=UPI0040354307